MKNTIKLLLLAVVSLAAGTTVITSCTDYQDEVDALDKRVTILETLVNRVNTNLTSLQTIVDAMDMGDYITNVTNTPTGTIITFAKHGAITILNGQPGEDAAIPAITVEKDAADGNYYWKIDGQWLLDTDGNRVRANGVDGQKGTTPEVRINPETGEWEYRLDGGKWQSTGMSAKGKDGKDAPGVVINAQTSEDGKYVTITINNNGVTENIDIPLKEAMPIFVTSVKLNFAEESVTIKKGNKLRINYTIEPQNATFKDVFFYNRSYMSVNTGNSDAVTYEQHDDGNWYICGNDICSVTMRIVPRFTQDNSVYDEIIVNVIP